MHFFIYLFTKKKFLKNSIFILNYTFFHIIFFYFNCLLKNFKKRVFYSEKNFYLFIFKKSFFS